ncbi:right-handed parallel beta-helix repeat-containing protein [Xanthomonas sp. CFBP 8703]|uniref:Right-handed parallel beta-helix repeat-containing protein n=1 Tax=Xanthomonas bonasiae TaxID=2810351 RepID=A0ABS3B5K4_9XANT|nr:right-handed parallel beta-helix repeat-containing protein [Xanthomonas bonasiae]MBN6103776.1 right-handed parallel beta-helix repeat-containing protein [Xanthomonas bonasiae]
MSVRRMRWWVLVLLVAASVVHAQTFRLYLAPDGDDAAAGTSAATALKTLSAAQQRLLAQPPPAAVEIVVAPGTYLGQSVRWTFRNGAPLRIVAASGAGTMPHFDGRGGGTWFTLRGGGNQRTQLQFVGLEVSDYWMAMDLGSSNAAADGNAGNEIRDMRFTRIGGIHGQGDPAYSYAAIRLQNSRDNVIADNQFSAIENSKETSGYIHALYLARHSTGNTVEGNSFTDVNGDVVRTRDASDDTQVRGNHFVRAGKYAAFSDWFDPEQGECPSQGGRFVDNTVGAGYYGAIPATATTGADDACGALGTPRIVESGTVHE